MSLPATRTLWEEGSEPGREMVALGVALALTVAAFDLLLSTELGLVFDLGFAALCVGLALAVRPRDFFTIGVLPPLLMLSTFLLLAASRSEAIARADDNLAQAVISGLSHHSVTLVVGYALALGVLVVRRQVGLVRDEAWDAGADDSLLVEAGPTDGPTDGTGSAEITRTGRGPRLPV